MCHFIQNVCLLLITINSSIYWLAQAARMQNDHVQLLEDLDSLYNLVFGNTEQMSPSETLDKLKRLESIYLELDIDDEELKADLSEIEEIVQVAEVDVTKCNDEYLDRLDELLAVHTDGNIATLLSYCHDTMFVICK